MRYVFVALTEASKIDFTGADKLSKTDHIVLLHVKDKKTVTKTLQAKFDELKCAVDFYEIAAATEYMSYLSFLIGYHSAAKHEVYVITADKSKIPGKIAKEAHIYTSFKSVATAVNSKKTEDSKKTSSSKKKTEAKVENLVESLTKGDTGKAKEQLMGLAEAYIKDKFK